MESAGPHGCCGKGKKKVSGILEAEKCDGLCHPGLPLNGTVHIKKRIVTGHLNVGFKPTENIQTATQNLVEIADVSIPVHGTMEVSSSGGIFSHLSVFLISSYISGSCFKRL